MEKFAIICAGWARDALTLGGVSALERARRVLLRTGQCGCAEYLRARGIAFETLDGLHERAGDFDELTALAVQTVLERAREGGLAYVVNDPSDRTAARLMALAGERIHYVAGPHAGGDLWLRAGSDLRVIAAADHPSFEADASVSTLVCELSSRTLASEVKLKLMASYPETLPVYLAFADGPAQRVPLPLLDRARHYDHRTCALIPAVRELEALERYSFAHLNEIMRRLRAPDGCPWDREQTHASLRTNMVEEAYEVVDAIDRGEPDELYDELGDVLLQVVFHAEIARQHGQFEIGDVTSAICRKLISRHPHIFGEESAADAREVLALWERAKKREKSLLTQADAMRALSRGMPSLLRAAKVQKKAAAVGFDWRDAANALPKVLEEAAEVGEALAGSGNPQEEVGDLLFAVVNVARLLGLDPELALSGATDKFLARFERMERMILDEGKAMEGMSLDEMDEYWARVKMGRSNDSTTVGFHE